MWADSKDAEIDHNALGMWRETIVLGMLGWTANIKKSI